MTRKVIIRIPPVLGLNPLYAYLLQYTRYRSMHALNLCEHHAASSIRATSQLVVKYYAMSAERVVQPPTQDQNTLLLQLVLDTAKERHLQLIVVHIQRLRAARQIQRAWRNFHCDWPGIQLDFKEFSRKQRLKRRIASQALIHSFKDNKSI